MELHFRYTGEFATTLPVSGRRSIRTRTPSGPVLTSCPGVDPLLQSTHPPPTPVPPLLPPERTSNLPHLVRVDTQKVHPPDRHPQLLVFL